MWNLRRGMQSERNCSRSKKRIQDQQTEMYLLHVLHGIMQETRSGIDFNRWNQLVHWEVANDTITVLKGVNIRWTYTPMAHKTMQE